MNKHLIKAAASALCSVMLVFVLTACEQKQVSLDEPAVSSGSEPDGADSASSGPISLKVGAGIENYKLPEIGEEIVVMTIKNYGDVKIRLFPDETEKGAENFKTLVQNGFYDELIFHRVVDGFVIQGGDPKGNGTGGVDAWGSETGFEQTISNHLYHVPGAVAYAIGQDKLNKSQFYIVTGEAATSEFFEMLRDYYGVTFTPEIEELYYQTGGQPYLDGGYEIFGQVFDGLEHCLAIQKVPVNSETSKPMEAVVIEKAVVTAYDGAEPHWLSSSGAELEISSDEET